MKVSALSQTELTHELAKQGISLGIGPFVVRIQSTIRSVVEGIWLLYAEYPIQRKTDFADFHVRLQAPRTLRRWFRPQVLFFFDGHVPFKPLPLTQAFPFFEWGLNWCVAKHANHYLILHAAVMEKHGRAVIMAGPPGSGKSTLCAGLVASGWRLLSDELALISPEDGWLTPLPRPVSLKNESIDVMRSFAPNMTFGRETLDTTKGTVAHMKVPEASMMRAHERVLPAWVVCATYDARTSARFEKRSKAQTFIHIVKNAFNYSVLGTTGFQTAVALIDSCDCYDFIYGSLDEAISLFETLQPPKTGFCGDK